MMQIYRNGVLVDLEPEEQAAWAATLAEQAMHAQVTRTQALLALFQRPAGSITSDDILAAIDAMQDATEKGLARIYFDSPVWKRSDPFVSLLGTHFGLSAGDIDALFEAASAL